MGKSVLSDPGVYPTDAVLGSSLPEEPKEGFRASAGDKTRRLVLEIRAKKDIKFYKTALAIKMASR